MYHHENAVATKWILVAPKLHPNVTDDVDELVTPTVDIPKAFVAVAVTTGVFANAETYVMIVLNPEVV